MIAEAIAKIASMTRDAKRIEHAPDYATTGRYYVWHADESFTERAALDNIVDNLKNALPTGVPIYHAVTK